MTIKCRTVAKWCGMMGLVACWALPASAQNLVLNPGFETGPAGTFTFADKWETFTFAPQAGTLDMTMPHGGTTAVRACCGTVDPPPGTGSFGMFQRVLNIIPGTKYTFNVWAKAESNDYLTDGPDGTGREDVGVKFEWHTDPNGATSLISQVEYGFILGLTGPGVLQNPVLNDTWQLYSFEATAPEGAGHFRPVFAARHITEAVYFDDISLTQLLPPDTPNFAFTIDRSTGNISMKNNGTATGKIKEVRITSASGALDPISWTSIAGNYDMMGNDSVDADDNWTRQTQTNAELRETGNDPSDGGSVIVNQVVNLGNNAWIKSLGEDLVAEVVYADGSAFKPGETRPAAVTFMGGPNDAPFDRSDLNFDGSINSADWPLLRDKLFVGITTTSKALAYQAGDLSGDFKVDFGDLNMFKADYNAALGAGAFEAMIAGVPEPSTLALLATCGVGLVLSLRRRTTGRFKAACVLLALLAVIAGTRSEASAAQSINFTTFTVDNYPLAEGGDPSRFNFPTYTTTPTSAVLDISSNPHVFYGGPSILNKRITGTINPGNDDDFVGLALGYTAGDTSNPNPAGADFLLLDWKLNDSVQDVQDEIDLAGSQFFHDLTLGYLAPAGVAMSRVTGTPTGDELWGHVDDLSFATDGGVTELQRGAARGSTGYTRNQDYVFDITYSPSKIIVKIDGTEEINISGSFPDGVLGLYSMDQNPAGGAPTYSNFKLSNFDEVLTATVNTLSGNITLTNATADPISLDGYALQSATASLEMSTWKSLNFQNLPGFAAGNGTGNGWEEGAGSSDSVLVEANLATSSILGAGQSISLGTAFDINGTQDLVLTYSDFSQRLVSTGIVNYVSIAGNGDFNGDGFVNAADYTVWRDNLGATEDGSVLSGNGNGGIVDQTDYELWKSNFGAVVGAGAAAAVPEPCSAAALLMLTACVLGVVRTRH